MRVALVSLGHGPSLALRNLERYCAAHDDVRGRASFVRLEREILEFVRAQVRSTRRWSFATIADELLREVVELRPAIVGFSCYLWSTDASIQVARHVKRLLPDVQIVLGGPDVGPRAEALLAANPAIDAVVRGDGEVPMLEIVRRHIARRPHDLASIPGVVARGAPASLVRRGPEVKTDASLLGGVYTAELEEGSLTPEAVARWSWPNLLYETMRGCPYACSYCMYGKVPVSTKEVDVVVAELGALLSRGIRVEIIDPTFTTYTRRAKEILGRLAELSYAGSLVFEAYPDSLDAEMISLLSRARVDCVGIGFQTLSQEGLAAVSRPKNLAKFERAVHLLRDAGVGLHVDVIYGLPATTAGDYVATMDYLFDLGITEIVVYRLLGLPGSPMLDDVDQYGLVFNDQPPYELLQSSTMSLDDILFCERFREAFDRLRALGEPLLRTFARASGGLSPFVTRVMDSGALEGDDPAALQRVLAELMVGGAAS